MQKLSLVVVFSTLLAVTSGFTLAADATQVATPPTAGNMNNVIASIQDQIQQVSDSIPSQIKKAQASNHQHAAAQKKATQEQLAHLQDEITQLQAQNQQAIAGLQKEIKELEQIK
jgi:cell shape-determining protein MreC